ncbi:MAG TPA: hypothetical protein VHB79_01355 [Polyangiaceae bacterium]|nr:hypothetical protein [Polyangiaceae bacterium]
MPHADLRAALARALLFSRLMFPAVFLALPLLFPVSNGPNTAHIDLTASAQTTAFQPRESFTAPVVPALVHYEHESGDVSLSLSPGGPCTGACVKLAGTF